MSVPVTEMRRRLIELARPVADRIAEHRRREAFARAFATVWPWLLAAPLARLVLAFVGFDVPGVWAFVALAPVAPAAVLLLAVLGRDGERASQREALILIDDKLGLADRMNAAAEFLGARKRTPLMDAAIRDAESKIQEAAEKYVTVAPVPLRVPREAFIFALIAIVIYLLPTFSPEWEKKSRVTEGDREIAEVEAESGRREPGRREDKESVVAEAPAPEQPKLSREETDGEVSDSAEPEEDVDKQKRSSSASGRSSQTQATGGSSASRGQASQQSQPSKTGEKAKEKAARKNAKESEQKDDGDREKRDEKESGSTVGRGSGKGSSRSPTASPWSSKDQVSSKEEQELEDDEDIEDDFDESKARGGVQPQLRSRKPPVNRDLQIGFGGGRPNPMANGRGGAGPPKKQRGVAQLVLGIHFPDHISGKPNPGMSKITQEQIDPQPEAADRAEAGDRGRRSQPTGPVARPRLMPWMQTLVRDYFSNRRPSF